MKSNHNSEPSADLSRFVTAHQRDFSTALAEITAGRKRSHWMWYIFPQLQGLGKSPTAQYYALRDITQAQQFLQHPYLGQNLQQISQVLLTLPTYDAHAIFGSPDDWKLRSCMTLFAKAAPEEPIFQSVLEQYFHGRPDPNTLRLLEIPEFLGT